MVIDSITYRPAELEVLLGNPAKAKLCCAPKTDLVTTVLEADMERVSKA